MPVTVGALGVAGTGAEGNEQHCAFKYGVETSISRPRSAADRVVRLKNLRVILFSVV